MLVLKIIKCLLIVIMLFQEVLKAKNRDSLSKFFKKLFYKTVIIPR